MPLVLHSLERRVLGVLLEKSLTQPEYYPMTLNAIVAGCNQKNNRSPVMELDEEAVWQTIEQLRGKSLVSKVLPSGSARTERYKHEVEAALKWEKPLRAVMTELLLRGPQTVGELRTRASRMYAFENIEAVSGVIDALQRHDPPLVVVLPRGPRESAVRYAHTLHPPDEAPESALAHGTSPAGEDGLQSRERHGGPSASGAARVDDAAIENLQAEVAELHQAIAELRRRIETLEAR